MARVATIIKNGNKRVWPLNDLKGISIICMSDVKCSIKALIGFKTTIDKRNDKTTLIKPINKLSVTYIKAISSLLAPKHNSIADSFISSL